MHLQARQDSIRWVIECHLTETAIPFPNHAVGRIAALVWRAVTSCPKQYLNRQDRGRDVEGNDEGSQAGGLAGLSGAVQQSALAELEEEDRVGQGKLGEDQGLGGAMDGDTRSDGPGSWG